MGPQQCLPMLYFPTHLSYGPSYYCFTLSPQTSNMVFLLILRVYSSLFYFTGQKSRSHQQRTFHVFKSISLLPNLPTCLPAYIPTCLHPHLPTYLPTYPSTLSRPVTIPVGQALPEDRRSHPLTYARPLFLQFSPSLSCIIHFSLSPGTLLSLKNLL